MSEELCLQNPFTDSRHIAAFVCNGLVTMRKASFELRASSKVQYKFNLIYEYISSTYLLAWVMRCLSLYSSDTSL